MLGDAVAYALGQHHHRDLLGIGTAMPSATTPSISTMRSTAWDASPLRTPPARAWESTGATTIPRSSRSSRSCREFERTTSRLALRSRRYAVKMPFAPGGVRPVGMVRNAWNKDYRPGIPVNSDHGLPHESSTMVYTARVTRQGIFNAIRRRTYGSTDNVLLDVRAANTSWLTNSTPPSRTP